MAIIIKAKIEDLKYKSGGLIKANYLQEYNLLNFDINKATASGIVEIDKNNKLAFSKWITPKRTRSYPFARIYDTYSFGGKRITIIPVIKDEGIGASKNKSNNDRINFITLSWMNLTNVYVILAWYCDAEKMSDYRITNQKFDVDYVNEKIKEISEFQFDAHHWNNKHFQKDFAEVYNKAVKSYEKIGKKLAVKMHSASDHNGFLGKIISEDKKSIDLEKFAEQTLGKSKLAANREICVKHKNEYLTLKSEKPVFEMKNNLGGRYYLTSDEIEINPKTKTAVIRECKNSTEGRLPKETDIKDGLFKILLFSQIKRMEIDGEEYSYAVKLKLTGKITSSLMLPTKQDIVEKFVLAEKISGTEKKLLEMLNEEASLNGYQIEISNN
jgi:hypothetical protein